MIEELAEVYCLVFGRRSYKRYDLRIDERRGLKLV